jgi:hypothetical protein
MSGPTILGGISIMNMANSLLDNGRAIFARNGGTGLSARSRAQVESFMQGGTALFNQLYAKTEMGEVANNITILALRAKHSHNVAEGMFDNGSSAASNTSGTNIDTTA